MYFEVKVLGTDKEQQTKLELNYLVDACDFAQAETKSVEDAFVYGTEIFAKDIKRSKVGEVVGDGTKEFYYKIKVKLIVFDCDKERKTNWLYLVNANDTDDAVKVLREYMKDSATEYTIGVISETKINNVL